MTIYIKSHSDIKEIIVGPDDYSLIVICEEVLLGPLKAKAHLKSSSPLTKTTMIQYLQVYISHIIYM